MHLMCIRWMCRQPSDDDRPMVSLPSPCTCSVRSFEKERPKGKGPGLLPWLWSCNAGGHSQAPDDCTASPRKCKWTGLDCSCLHRQDRRLPILSLLSLDNTSRTRSHNAPSTAGPPYLHNHHPAGRHRSTCIDILFWAPFCASHPLTHCITAPHTKGAPRTLFVMVIVLVMDTPIMFIRWSAHPLLCHPSD